MGRPEADWPPRLALSVLGNGLASALHHEDALSVQEAELSSVRRIGTTENNILRVQGNLAVTYKALGRLELALPINRDVFLGFLKLYGEEHGSTLLAANNYASTLSSLERYGEASKLLRKLTPVARRALGENNNLTLTMRWHYARALYKDNCATLDDLRESVETLGSVAPLWTRVFGPSHPDTPCVQRALEEARKALAARAAASSAGAA